MKLPFTLTETKEFDCCGFGINAVDHLIVVPRYPGYDDKVRFTEYEKSAGGETASAMVCLQRLGLKTAYAGRFGSDEDGRFGLRAIEYEGVNLDFGEMIDGAGNQIAFIIIESRAFEVPGGCRDTTGAGDAFHGGFIYGMLSGEDLETCMRLGNAVAALKCRSLGARAALPTVDELKEFLRG